MKIFKKQMLHIHLFLRDVEAATPQKKCVIYCQLQIDTQSRDTAFSTRIKIQKQYWKSGYIDPAYILAETITRQLQQIERAFQEIYDILPVIQPNAPVTYKSIRQMYEVTADSVLPKPKAAPLFTAVLVQYIEHKKNVDAVEKSTLKNYRTRKKNVLAFLNHTEQSDIKIDEIRYRHFNELKHYLLSLNTLGIDHINKHLVLMKSVLEYALKAEYISNMPVSKLDLKYSSPKPPKYIDEAGRRRIYDCTHQSVEIARDIAVFLMHTGFSYTDYLTLQPEHLKDGFFKKARNKTKIYSTPPLLPEAASIIEKYGSIEALPRPDMSDLNKELKYLGSFCGIEKSNYGFTLSTSVFRETFSSMMENEYMLTNRVIMFMMGHTNPKQLNTYSNVQPNRILHDMGQKVSKKTLDFGFLETLT